MTRMTRLNEIISTMEAGKAQLIKSIDLSVAYMKKNPKQKEEITQIWEDFLGEFIEYVKQKEKESGEDLIKGIPITKLIKLLK